MEGRTLVNFDTGRLDFWVWAPKSYAGRKIEVFNGEVSLGKKELAIGTVPNSGEIKPESDVACAEYKLLLPPPNRPYQFNVKMDGKDAGQFTDIQTQRRYKADYKIDPQEWYNQPDRKGGSFFTKYLKIQTVFDSPVLPQPTFKEDKGPAGSKASMLGKKKEELPAEPTAEDYLGKDYKIEVTYAAPDGQTVTTAELPGDYKANISLTVNGMTYTHTIPIVRKPNAKDMAGIVAQEAGQTVEMNLFDYTASIDFGRGWVNLTLFADPAKLFVNKTVELWSGEKLVGKIMLKAEKDSPRASGTLRFPILPVGTGYSFTVRMLGKNVGTLELTKFAQPAKKIDVFPDMWYSGGVGASANFNDREQWVEGQFFERYLRFDKYIFDARNGFPKPYLIEPRRLPDAADCSVNSFAENLGEHTLTVKYLNEMLEEVEAPQGPGRYYGEVTITSGSTEFKAYEVLCAKPTGKDGAGMPEDTAQLVKSDSDERSAELLAAAYDIKRGKASGSIEMVADNAWLGFKYRKGFTVTTPYKYWVHAPPGYDPNGTNLWPTLIFFHGAGMGGWHVFSQRGGLGFLFRGYGSDTRSKFLIFTPNSDGGNWGVNSCIKLIEMLKVMHPINPNRIILAGQSAGSALAIGVIGSRPDLFCGLILCAHARSMPPYHNQRCVQNNVAIWHFCGEKDGGRQQGNADVSFSCGVGAGANARYSRLPGWGHGTEHYAFGQGETFDWMIELDRRKPAYPDQAAKSSGALGGSKASLKSKSASSSGIAAMKAKTGGMKKPESTLKKPDSTLKKPESTLKKPGTLERPSKLTKAKEEAEAAADEPDEIKGDEAPPPPEKPAAAGLSAEEQNKILARLIEEFDPKNWKGVIFNFNSHPEITISCGKYPFFWTDAAEAHWNGILKEREAKAKLDPNAPQGPAADKAN